LVSRLPARPVVVEIGHGDGSFLAALAELRPEGRYIGFDPNGASKGQGAVELRAAMFDPVEELPVLKPDLLISRHVLEHLTNPLGFLQRLCFAAGQFGLRTLAYLEVPCIDRVLDTGRTVDFYYEHSSQFTTESFTRMLNRCAVTIEDIAHGYDGEVVYGLVWMAGDAAQIERSGKAFDFAAAARESQSVIGEQLDQLHRSGKRVAIWGGTGKAAAFIARYNADAERFPIVVDSDRAKVGMFVPGTGQEILFRDYLIDYPADVVIIPPQWRARDIIAEMRRHGIQSAQILIEHDGRLIDFATEPHPYR
jgi:SAM-dependent methyltransferase